MASQDHIHKILHIWAKIPMIFRAILVGWLVMEIGVFGFGFLLGLNIRTTALVPWAAILGVPLLWGYWQYLNGRWWPRATSDARARNLNATPLTLRQWKWALLAGLAGLAFTVNLGAVYSRIIGEGMSMGGMPEGVPWWTLVPTFIMLSVFAGFFEEAGLRGYLQTMAQRRHGPVIAILLSSVAFTFAHFGHDWGQAMALPFFIASLWYGTLTFAAGSILPMIVVHIALDFYLFGRVLLFGEPLSPVPLAESGLDTDFAITAAIVIASGAVLAWLLRKNYRVRREEQAA